MPQPLQDLIDPLTSLPQPSEPRVLEYMKVLSEDIGFRTVGTKEHALADTWMVEQVNAFKHLCERAIEKETGRKLECEVWRQQGNGSHRSALNSMPDHSNSLRSPCGRL
jgi:hypothetical protein